MLKYSKYIVSFLLAVSASSFFICGIMTNIWHSLILLLYLAATIFILFFDFSKLEIKKYETIKKVMFYLFPLLMTLFIWQEYLSYYFWVNYAILFLFHLLLNYILKNNKISCTIQAIFSYILCMINEFVYIVRGIPIMPNDIYALSTGAAVSGQYSFVLSSKMVICTFGFILLLFVIFKFLDFTPTKKQRTVTLTLLLTSIVAIFLALATVASRSGIYFAVRDTHEHLGFFFSTLVFSQNLSVEKPDTYVPDKVESLYDSYKDDEFASEDLPNVIIIMNESFSDLSYLGDFKTNEEYLSYFNELKKESAYGNLIVPVYGGGTCNTEFEVLTGCSTTYLPQGTYAYMQYIEDELKDSLPWYFKELSFNTYAVHPFWEFAWNRNKIYSELGFDDFISLEDMANLDTEVFNDNLYLEHYQSEDLEIIRTLVSDRESYNQIIDIYENDPKNKFIFSITMQNHGGYTYDEPDFENTVIAEEYDDDKLNQYLTLVKESDIALEEFINYFKNKDEKTVILFFGDHQPSMNKKTIAQIMGKESFDDLTMEEKQKTYTTPFLIWKNYDSTSKELDIVSTNYLSLILKQEIGLPLTKWDKIRKDAHSQYKAINPFGALDSNNVWNELENISLPEEYELIQYNMLFDN
ncbi:MAG: LTA synthase family protein [Clostridia bacterium]|nr:LTA synthase family protein [Clostridia bacterium]